ncbi:Uncharacterised protein [Klebsiella pneumoniae]|nr:Uncharacterised protein [Klebsiella pneumoniae]
MQRQFMFAGKIPCLLQIGERQHFTVVSVFQTEQAGDGEVHIIRFDKLRHDIQRQRTVSRRQNRLWLDAAQNRCTARFVFIVVCQLADNILFAALAVAQQRHEIGLCCAGEKQGGRLTAQACHFSLQLIDGGIIAVHIIPGFSCHHGGQHRLSGAGYGITT